MLLYGEVLVHNKRISVSDKLFKKSPKHIFLYNKGEKRYLIWEGFEWVIWKVMFHIMCSQIFLKLHLNREEKVERSRKSLKVSNL